MSKLREAAQAAVKSFEEHGYSPLTIKAIWALRDALAEDRLAEQSEYQFWGTINGSPGGRWVATQINPNEIWPVGTALYVRLGEAKK